MGDGTLMEFASVVDALNFAIDVQRAMAERNAAVPDDQRVVYRVGINIGDIIVDGDDIYGDGVNVAARLQEIADPGGICVSRTVFNHVKGKVDLAFEDLGEQEVKNIPEPIRVYRVPIRTVRTDTVVTGSKDTSSASWKRPALVTATATLVVVAGIALWMRPWEPTVEPASVERMAFPLPDKPSIAVLPFTNMSDDPSQEYFADGITEDLITDLSKISGLFVIARNSSFSYKGQQVKVRQVAEELGVRFVLEGSVRRVGDQVRINAQLIDATTGGHLWAERYDGNLADVFSLQDRVTSKIVKAMAVELSPSEELKIKARGTANLNAHDAYLLGLRHLNAIKKWRPNEIVKARHAFEKAIALDPSFAAAHAGLAWTIWFQADFDIWFADGGFRLHKEAFEMAVKSLELSDNPLAHRLLARQYLRLVRGGADPRHDEAVMELRKAVALEPNNADSLAELAHYLVFAGDPDEAATLVRDAKRLNPNFPNWYHRPAGISEYLSGRYEAAAEEFKSWFEDDELPCNSAVWLAAAEAQTGNNLEAKAALQAASIADCDYTTISSFSYFYPFKNQEHLNSLLDGLRKAGLQISSE
jgi:TolB-like protein/Tfp pilus assembly protein PilF